MRIAASSFLACSAFAACVLAGQAAVADGPEASTAFTNASLQGRYAYVNNSGDVASLGPIVFNGRGGLSVRIVTNVPCEDPAPGCSRGVRIYDVSGTYSVRPNGTGVARANFGEPTGPITYDFMVVEADSRGASPLAIEVFAAGRGGGLAGQLIAPTWTRIFDR